MRDKRTFLDVAVRKSILSCLALAVVLLPACGELPLFGDVDGELNENATAVTGCVGPESNLQAVLDQGLDLALCPARTYMLHAPLYYRASGQKISTPEAKHPREYATLKIAAPSAANAVTGLWLNDLVLEKVVVDGNRRGLGAATIGTEVKHALVLMHAGEGNTVRNTVLRNTRTWSSLQLNVTSEGQCAAGLVENNIILWAGCDSRGNGCAPGDAPGKWGDGVSMPCRRTVIRNNLIIDATDVGIVLFGAPGSTVTGNHVVSVSREAFGGVALVDKMDQFAISGSEDGKDIVTDYGGDAVDNNRLSALGARIHIGVAIGPPVWFGPDWIGARTFGASVTGNLLDGVAFGYGIVANGSQRIFISANRSTAQHGGTADGVDGVAAAPGPFLYRPSTTVNPGALQEEFVADNDLTSLLRLHSCPRTSTGFWACGYANLEARAVVRLAYLEMLGREPDEPGWTNHAKRVIDLRLSGDDLRRELMASTEFQQRYPGVPVSAMQLLRQSVWESAMFRVIAADIDAGRPWPGASSLFDRAAGFVARGDRPLAVCIPTSQPAPDWGPKDGQCLPSCGMLGGTSSSAMPCLLGGKADAGVAYDVPYCCKESPTAESAEPSNTLEKGEGLRPGQVLLSNDGRFQLTYQLNGDLVLYVEPDHTALWMTGTAGKNPGLAVLQADGNFVVYDESGVPVWRSKTQGMNGSRVVMQDDGNLVIRTAAGVAVWSTRTGGH